MIIDFKEIPVANSGAGDQDSFELFCRDFFVAMGCTIIEDPSRGADGGKDLIIEQLVTGTVISTNKKQKYIVSCKHYAVSGKSVNANTDEPNIISRINKFQCDGFIGFYSTLPSTTLNSEIQAYNQNNNYKNYFFDFYDSKKIESQIIENFSVNNKFDHLFQRYFPRSYKVWLHSWHRLSKSDFEGDINNEMIHDFYRGFPPTWCLTDKYSFRRDAFDQINSILEKKRVCLITGAGGEGKSTLLKQIGIYYYNNNYEVYFTDEPDDSIEIIFDLIKIKPNKRYLFLIDNASFFKKMVLFTQKAYLLVNVKIVLASRKNEWNAFLHTAKIKLDIKKFISESEISLGKLSNNELLSLKKLLIENKVIGDAIEIDQEEDRSFLLATMIAYTQGKPLKMVLSDVVENIAGFNIPSISEKALKALAVIVYIEHLSAHYHLNVFCNEQLLYDIVSSSRIEYVKIIELIKGETFIQPSKNHFITRNPIITELYYSILFSENVNSYFTEKQLADEIISACVSKQEGYSNYFLSLIPKYYFDKGSIDYARELYDYILSCGFFPESYNDILKNEINLRILKDDYDHQTFQEEMIALYKKNSENFKLLTYWGMKEYEWGNYGDYDTPYSCRWLFKRAHIIKPTFAELYFPWVEIEVSTHNIGSFDVEYSALWIIKEGIEKANNNGLYLTWAKLEIDKENIGAVDKENTARWILKQGQTKTDDGAISYAWANLEVEKGNIGTVEEINTARWIFKRGIERTNYNGLYLAWANLEAEKENIGTVEEINTARWIFKRSIERTNDSGLYLTWANLEAEKGNIGAVDEENTARWIFKHGIERTNDSGLYLPWANLEAEKGNVGAVDEENTARWIFKHGIERANDSGLYLAWANLEAEKGNIGTVEEINTARWIFNHGIERTSYGDLYLTWANLEIEMGNIGAVDEENTAHWIFKHGIERTNFGGLYLAWANLEAKKGNIGTVEEINTARWIFNHGIERTNYGGLYLAWANLEAEKGNIGTVEEINTARWIFNHGIERTSYGDLYLTWANLEIEMGNIGAFDKENTARWILKDGTIKTNYSNLYLMLAFIESTLNNYGSIDTEYSVRWLYFKSLNLFDNVHTYINWAAVEYFCNKIGDVGSDYSAIYLITKAFEKSSFPYIEFNGIYFYSVQSFEKYIMSYIEENGNISDLLRNKSEIVE